MKKFLKTVLTVLLVLILVPCLVLLTSTVVHKVKTKVSKKANTVGSYDYDEVKSALSLSWSDEFGGDTLSDDWVFVGHKKHTNNELQVYADSYDDGNTVVADGVLSIIAKKESRYGYAFTSAKLTTQGTRSFKYGLFEIKAKFTDDQGTWPAFWMMGQLDYFPTVKNLTFWPLCGEIDIMEYIGPTGSGSDEGNRISGNLHWCNTIGDKLNKNYRHASSPRGTELLDNLDPSFFEEYHTYSLFWNKEVLVWYLDGEAFMEVDISSSDYDCLRANGWYILLNLAVGGDWPKDPAEGYTGSSFDIEYVRVYQ